MVTWSDSVNTKFYDMETKTEENVTRTEYESGRVSTVMKNSRAKMSFSFSLMLWTRAEEVAFWTWYKDTAKSGAESVQLTNLLTQSGTKEYIFTDEPSVSSGAYPRECSISVKEV